MATDFDKHADWFVDQINSRKRMLPLFATVSGMMAKRVDEDLNKLIDAHGYNKVYEEENLVRYSLDEAYSRRHKHLRKTLRDANIFTDLLPKMTLVSLVSVFDAYLRKLVTTLFKIKPEVLNGSQKQLTYAELSNFGTMDDAREFVTECELDSLLRESHTYHFEWLEKRLKLPLREGLDCWPFFIELTERRNLLVHADGIVNNQYLDNCEKAGINVRKDTNIGDKLVVESEYYERACDCITEIGIKLNQVMWRKLVPDDVNEADSSLISNTYDLLVDEEFKLAQDLLQFAIDTKAIKFASETNALYLKLNLAIAYKSQNKDDECIAIIKGTDWSALSDMFKIAAAALLEDFDEAALLMKRIGQGEGIRPTKREYEEWPVFRWFRKTDDFKLAYKEVFGVQYEITTDREPQPEKDDIDEQEEIAD
jgi:hypothetical protein